MAYSNTWSSLVPIGSATPARDIDDNIRQLKASIEERMADVIGNTNWATDTYPLIDGSTYKSIAALTAAVGSKPSVNATLNKLPRKDSGGNYVDSGVTDDGTTISFSRQIALASANTTINGVVYSWPNSAPSNGYFLQYNNGNLSWVSVAAAGAIGGAGTTGKISKFSASNTIADSILSESGGILTAAGNFVANAITCSGLSSSSNITAPGAIFGFNGLQTYDTVIINSLAAPSESMNFSIPSTNPQINRFNGHVRGSTYKAVFDFMSSGSGGTEIWVAGTKVIQTRITGWGAPSGATRRTSFDPSTVTLVELAETVAALISDLRSHGLIGN